MGRVRKRRGTLPDFSVGVWTASGAQRRDASSYSMPNQTRPSRSGANSGSRAGQAWYNRLVDMPSSLLRSLTQKRQACPLLFNDYYAKTDEPKKRVPTTTGTMCRCAQGHAVKNPDQPCRQIPPEKRARADFPDPPRSRPRPNRRATPLRLAVLHTGRVGRIAQAHRPRASVQRKLCCRIRRR